VTTGQRVPPLVATLVDDAGLFPPEALPMPAALARHRADAAGGHPVLTHRFLCLAARLPELLGHLGGEDRITLGLITQLDPELVGDAVEVAGGDRRVTVAALEGVLPPGPDPATSARRALAALAGAPAGVTGFVELPLHDGWRDALAVVADGGRAAKVRCGGPSPDLVPSPEALGEFVHACARAGVPFKATAGLHHAVRQRDERAGLEQHGFLNLLLAAARAVDGGSPGEVVDVLRAGDPDALVAEARALPEPVAEAARALLPCYGSCDTRAPVDDLVALGLVER